MKATIVAALASLACAAPAVKRQDMDLSSVFASFFSGFPKLPEVDGVPQLGGLAGYDWSEAMTKYGPAMMEFMTPEVTYSLAKQYVPEAKVVYDPPIKPRIQPDAKRKINKYGPFTLKGHGVPRPKIYTKDPNGAISLVSMDLDGQSFMFRIDEPICGNNCTVIAAYIGLMDEDGNHLGPKEGFYIHHINAFDIGKPMATPVTYCGSDDPLKPSVPKLILPAAGFIGRGDDFGDAPTLFQPRNKAFESGFHTGSRDSFLVQGDIVNYSNATRQVYAFFDLEYYEGIRGRDATAGLVSVIGCRVVSPKSNPNGPASTFSQKYPITVNGTFITAKGHMHNGGDSMIMRVNGKQVCKSHAIYHEDKLVDTELCEMEVPVKENDYVELESIYDVKKHPMRENTNGTEVAHDVMGGMDLMGVFGITFVIDPPPK